jgi:hypothetical protein
LGEEGLGDYPSPSCGTIRANIRSSRPYVHCITLPYHATGIIRTATVNDIACKIGTTVNSNVCETRRSSLHHFEARLDKTLNLPKVGGAGQELSNRDDEDGHAGTGGIGALPFSLSPLRIASPHAVDTGPCVAVLRGLCCRQACCPSSTTHFSCHSRLICIRKSFTTQQPRTLVSETAIRRGLLPPHPHPTSDAGTSF